MVEQHVWVKLGNKTGLARCSVLSMAKLLLTREIFSLLLMFTLYFISSSAVQDSHIHRPKAFLSPMIGSRDSSGLDLLVRRHKCATHLPNRLRRTPPSCIKALDSWRDGDHPANPPNHPKGAGLSLLHKAFRPRLRTERAVCDSPCDKYHT